MADRAITALVEATSMTSADLFAISQGGQAKKVTWETFYTYLAEALDGHGGISDISYTAPVSGSLAGTVTITLADGTTEAFTVMNGKSITGIADKWAVSASNSTAPSTWYDNPQTMTPTNRYLWHYQVLTFNDGTTLETDKAVTGVYGDTGQSWYVHIKWAAEEPDSDSDMKDVPDDWIGIYSGTSQTAPSTYTSYSWFEYKGEIGNTGTGITSVSLYSSSGLVDTYRVYFSDGTYTSFNVTNGASIQSINKTGTSGLTDTYTVTLTDGTTTTFTVTNGKSITSITPPSNPGQPGATDIYTINYNDGDTSTFSVYNGTNGTGSVSTVDGISPTSGDVSLMLFGSGHPTVNTVGALKQRYFDTTNSMLYVCTAITGSPATYTWQGASVTVDVALSTMSTNPLQNAVITGIVGTTPQYDSTSAYEVGDYCIYQKTRYRCTTAIATGGEAWDSSHWTIDTYRDQLDKHDSDISSLESDVTLLGTSVAELLTFEALHITGTVSANAMYIDDVRITADMRVLECTWGTPANVTSDIAWSTSSGRITFSNGFSGQTTVDLILGKAI